MPRTAPAADNAIPWPTIKRKTSDGRAPSAIRTPISRVRRATSYESNPYSPIQASKSDSPPKKLDKRAIRRSWKSDLSICSARSEEHTSELQSRGHLVCRLLLEKKNYPDC